MPNFQERFVIEANGLGNGMGVVLPQQGKSITLLSRSLGAAKRLWSICAKQMLAIIQDIQTWRPYKVGYKFYIQTN